MAAMAAWVAKPLPLSLQTSDTAFFPRCGCKWAAPCTPLSSSSRRVTARVSRAKLVTLVGKGGAGKTTTAVLAAQYYASTGLRTCLLIQSQDPTADVLLGQKLGSTPASFRNGNLTAFRLETTKMIIEPLAQIKSADARQNFSQGALDEIKGEELSVLLGMDPILAMGAIERLTGFSGGLFKGVGKKGEHEVRNQRGGNPCMISATVPTQLLDALGLVGAFMALGVMGMHGKGVSEERTYEVVSPSERGKSPQAGERGKSPRAGGQRSFANRRGRVSQNSRSVG